MPESSLPPDVRIALVERDVREIRNDILTLAPLVRELSEMRGDYLRVLDRLERIEADAKREREALKDMIVSVNERLDTDEVGRGKRSVAMWSAGAAVAAAAISSTGVLIATLLGGG